MECDEFCFERDDWRLIIVNTNTYYFSANIDKFNNLLRLNKV